MDAAHRGVTALAESNSGTEQPAGPIQAKALHHPSGAPENLSAQGSGQQLPGAIQAKMEQALGADFSSVRVHQGTQAASIGALAYTQGTDIHFAPGQYAPQSQSGQELLGHELAHVVQQSQGRVQATTQQKGAAINADAALEREADVMGASAARGQAVQEQVAVSKPGPVAARGAFLQQKTSYLDVKLGDHEAVINDYVKALDQAVQKAWALCLSTPTLGAFATLDGYTAKWVRMITQFGNTSMAPMGMHTAFGYAIESLATGPLAPAVPAQLNAVFQDAKGGTRPDIVLKARPGQEDVAWLDITASASAGHIFDKAGGWGQAPSFAEVTYPSVGPSDLKEMAGKAKANPDAPLPDVAGLDPAAYLANAERAAQELAAKRETWKVFFSGKLAHVKSITGRLHPTPEVPRRAETTRALSELLGIPLDEKTAGSIVAATGLLPTTYGFVTGFPVSVATGVSILLDCDPV